MNQMSERAIGPEKIFIIHFTLAVNCGQKYEKTI
jgi:hypothetical protein